MIGDLGYAVKGLGTDDLHLDVVAGETDSAGRALHRLTHRRAHALLTHAAAHLTVRNLHIAVVFRAVVVAVKALVVIFVVRFVVCLVGSGHFFDSIHKSHFLPPCVLKQPRLQPFCLFLSYNFLYLGLSFPEERAADPHQIRALLDGDLERIAHSHR